jgi:hypothetical protein
MAIDGKEPMKLLVVIPGIIIGAIITRQIVTGHQEAEMYESFPL